MAASRRATSRGAPEPSASRSPRNRLREAPTSRVAPAPPDRPVRQAEPSCAPPSWRIPNPDQAPLARGRRRRRRRPQPGGEFRRHLRHHIVVARQIVHVSAVPAPVHGDVGRRKVGHQRKHVGIAQSARHVVDDARPAATAPSATSARMVSMLTGTPASASPATTSSTRASSTSAAIRSAPGRVDSPPTSMMSAPRRCSSTPAATAAADEAKRPPSEKESG